MNDFSPASNPAIHSPTHPMNSKDAFFNALIRYIDCRIDEKIADRHDLDDTALGLACETSAAKDDLSKALGDPR